MGEEKKLIYLDNAATTKTAPEVVEAMLPYFTENYGNPSSVYSFAAKNKDAITKQREIIAWNDFDFLQYQQGKHKCHPRQKDSLHMGKTIY